MRRLCAAFGMLLALATAAWSQESPIEIPPVDRSPYSIGGFLEARPAVVWQDAGSASSRLRSPAGEPLDRRVRFDSRLQLDASYRHDWFSAQARGVIDGSRVDGDWTAEATAYEAYLSVKPAPSLTVDAGKKTLKWGKGYIWNPAAFLDRPKTPDDPALALEGVTVLSADYIRTFNGPLQALSLTPVLLPVVGSFNESFGERGHVNVAGRLYALLYDTDIDVMALAGGSRPSRVAVDASRNLRSNLEVHGEWVRVPAGRIAAIDAAGALVERRGPLTSVVAGIRFLSVHNTTFIADYFRNGAGYTTDEMRAYFDLVDRGLESLATTGDERLLRLAGAATQAGYGGATPMRNYVYARVTQPDALGVLYLMLGASAIVNADDGSGTFLPEVQYRATENLELRWLAGIQHGGRRTEFGEKQADLRIEMRVRYYL
jgi:hypothetical protein